MTNLDDAALDGSDLTVVAAVRAGLSVQLVDQLVESGRLSAGELDRLAFPRRTLGHRRSLGRLSPEQSDRLLRILRVVIAAEDGFADPLKARRWLRRGTTALDGQAPLDLLDTDIGARRVETLIGQIGHGIGA